MTNHEDGPSGYFLKFKDDSYMLNVDDRKYLYDSTEKDEAEGDAKRQHEMYQNGGVVVPIKIIEFEKWVKLVEFLNELKDFLEVCVQLPFPKQPTGMLGLYKSNESYFDVEKELLVKLEQLLKGEE